MQLSILAGALLAILPFGAYSQRPLEATSQQILHEGLALYTVEHATRVATDLLQASGFPTHAVRAYFSYAAGDSVHAVFAGGAGKAPAVLLEYRFPVARVAAATARRTGPRPLTAREQRLLQVRQQSMQDLPRTRGFEVPEHTSLNPVLLEKGAETWVYVLTGTTVPGLVPLGNDYLLRYSAAGKLLHQQKLHASYIAIGQAPAGHGVSATLHTHLPGAAPCITATDICTLLLYRSHLPGRQHVVLGEKYVSVFVPASQSLTVLTRAAFEKAQQAAR